MKQVKSTYKYRSKVILPRQEKESQIKNLKRVQFPFIAKALKMIMVMLVIGVVVIAYVHQYAVISKANYDMQDLQKQFNSVKAMNERMRIAIAQNESLKHIEEEARNRLGLVEPKDVVFISTGQEPAKQAKPTQIAHTGKPLGIIQEVGTWFKNITSVEAGTLDG